MNDLSKAKTITGWEITRDMEAGMLKIDQKRFISDFLKAERITSYYAIVLSIKAGSFITIN